MHDTFLITYTGVSTLLVSLWLWQEGLIPHEPLLALGVALIAFRAGYGTGQTSIDREVEA